MRFRLLLLVLLLGSICAAAAGPLDVSQTLERVRAKYGLPGCAAAVIQGGEVTALGAAGERRSGSHVPVTTEDQWQIGSCTKSMTAVLIACLVEEGKLRWDQPLADLLPGTAPDPSWRKLTLWDLVTHRTGLGHLALPEEFRRAVEGEAQTEFRRALAHWLLARAPAQPPGKSVYSNAGYALLGAIAEQATGKTYEALLRERIFQPLGLTSAGTGRLGTSDQVDQPWGHRRRGNELSPVSPTAAPTFPLVLAPAGSVHLSLRDFARYAWWWSVNEPHLLGPETFARLHTPPAGEQYAAGAWVTELPGGRGRALAHTGQLGGSSACFYAAPELACVVVYNVESSGWEWLADVLAEAVLKELHRSE